MSASQNTAKVTFRLPQADRDTLKALSLCTSQSQDAIIREALSQHLKNNADILRQQLISRASAI